MTESIVPQAFKDALRSSDTRDGVYMLVCDNDALLLNEALAFADFVNPLSDAQKAQNFKLLAPMKNTISVDDVRAFAAYESAMPVGAVCKTMILHRCDLIYRSGSDVLLKTIEEPSVHSLIILTAADPSGVPDVIRSRCMTFTRLGSGISTNYASILNLRTMIESANDPMQLSAAAGGIISYGIDEVIKAFTNSVRPYKAVQEMEILRKTNVLARTGNAQQAAVYITRGYHAMAHWPKAFEITGA